MLAIVAVASAGAWFLLPVFVHPSHDLAVDRPSCGFFFPSDAFVASARSFNMFQSMLQLGLID